MNITKENKDDLNAQLTIKIEKDDYEGKVNDVLKDYRKKASVKGFRPGKVPAGLIKKMYYKPVMVEEINKLLSESLSSYIRDENLDILGEPLPAEDKQEAIDWDNQSDFEFIFDLGLAPQINPDLSEQDEVPFYKIKLSDDLITKYKDSYLSQAGSYQEAEQAEEESMLTGDLVQVDENDEPAAEGLNVPETTILVSKIADEEAKKELIGASVGKKITLDVKKAFTNEADLAAMLHIEKEALETLSPTTFHYTLTKIENFKNAEPNQEFFNMVYGEGEVNSEEEFNERLKKDIEVNMGQESNQRFGVDAKKYLLNKVNAELPADFLKRWLMETNEEVSREQLEKEYPEVQEDLKWQLIKNKIAKENEIEISEEEIAERAGLLARHQFMQYGLGNIPDEHLQSYVAKLLEKPEDKRRYYEMLKEEKVLSKVKDLVKLQEKEVSKEEFDKLDS